LSRQTFIENNVNCPVLVTPENFDISYLPIIARPLVHSKGKNFVVLNSFSDFERHYNQNNQGWYYSNFINKEREFRVHCAHGKVLVLMEKSNPNNGNIAWNRAQNDTEPFEYVTWTRIDDENLKNVLVIVFNSSLSVTSSENTPLSCSSDIFKPGVIPFNNQLINSSFDFILFIFTFY